MPTPKLNWTTCYEIAECATVAVPLDYDQPRGAKTELAVLRIKAKDQKNRLGSLFLNPGGPGVSSTEFALYGPKFLSEALLQRFDIVGVDPRGVGASSNIRCWNSVQEQRAVFDEMKAPFPWGVTEESKYAAGAKKFGAACSTTGQPLAGAMSTAEVARDMDVMRRAVGDAKLTYLGFSYGSVLGQFYANMFPDRFRALAIDGVVDPRAWIGAGAAGNRILDDRMRSSEGAYRALREILQRCDRAGERYCAFAAGDPAANFAAIANRLRAEPLVVTTPDGPIQITYADFVGAVLYLLYEPTAGEDTTKLAAEMWALINGGPAAEQAEAALVGRVQQARAKGSDAAAEEVPYDNTFETLNGVVCTDGRFPRDADSWLAATARRDARAPYFGRAWGWLDVPCASDTWTVRDEDAYRGPFNRRTAAPVLVVGNTWDPATPYHGAVAASRLLPNSRLLSSDNWGHASYGTGICVTEAIDRYLLSGALPARGTVCAAARQPFTEPVEASPAGLRAAAAPGKQLPPVAAPKPPSVLTGPR
ncbi:alpha/beta hydrolase [Micromonospora okii]|uniref:alpha/beta hydrolase n=1 Tax=Micromonospora okii TaxID=1182970 RepID=UPI001E5B958B|nr:alpha/beta hydrolase [Micromonospora okii]